MDRIAFIIDSSEVDRILVYTALTKSRAYQEIITVTDPEVGYKEYCHVLNEGASNIDVFIKASQPILNGFEYAERLQKFPRVIRDRCSIYIVAGTIPDEYGKEEGVLPDWLKRNSVVKKIVSLPFTWPL